METYEQRAEKLEERVMSHDIDKKHLEHLEELWSKDPRWQGIERPYTAEDVLRARGTLRIDHTFAQAGAQRSNITELVSMNISSVKVLTKVLRIWLRSRYEAIAPPILSTILL